MEPARTLHTLWRRRRLVALGAAVALLAALLSIYRVGLFPPSLESRSNVFASASSQILVDAPNSAFADTSFDLDELDTRAGVFARFMASPAAITLIAKEADIPFGAIEARGPFELNLPEVQQAPTAEERGSQILGEGALYRLRFENNPGLPIISVFAQAPEPEEAATLAAAAPAALSKYIERIQAQQQTPLQRQVVIRQLGSSRGGTVNEGASLQIATLVFIVVLGGWCMLLIPARTIARGWREGSAARSRPGANGAPDGHRNGRRRSGEPPQPERRRQRAR